MKRGQFSQEKIVAILHQAEKGEQSIQAICKEHSVTETTFYRWRKAYGGAVRIRVKNTHFAEAALPL